MRGSARVVVAGIAFLLAAAPAGGAGIAGGSTPAAAPFADAWANVPAAAAARRARNIVVFGVSALIAGFGPESTGSGASSFGGYESTRGPFMQNSRGTWVKDIVTDAKATESSLSYTISPKAFWYWGGRRMPVTYKDFVYTLQKLDDPSTNLPHGPGMGNLDPTRFTHRGDRQVTFFWRTSNCSGDFPCGPFADWQSLFESLYPSLALTGLDFNTIWASCVCGSDGKPVSDGPFYVANYTPGQGVVLRANPYWGGSKPALAEIDFRLFADTSSLYEAMRLGAVDAAPFPGTGQTLTELDSTRGLVVERFAERDNLEQLQLREGDAPAGNGVSKGSSNVLLRAPWMREAIALAIDRGAIASASLGPGPGVKPADSLLFFPFEAGYRPSFASWDYNPKEALSILKRHCIRGTGPVAPDPGNTRIWQCAGLPATFGWTWTAGNPIRLANEQLAKRELMSIGIALSERPLPANVIFTPSGIFSGDFDITEFGENTTGDPSDWTEQYRCRGDRNFTGFCSDKVDALLKAAGSQLDPAKRIVDYQVADRLLAETVPVIPLYNSIGGLVRKADLLGVQPGPPEFIALETWRWRH